VLGVIAIIAVTIAGCGGGGGDKISNTPQFATVNMTFQSTTRAPITDIKTMTVTISGSYMNDIVDTFDFDTLATFTKSYQVSVGVNRKFHIDAKNEAGEIIYKGETIKDVIAGVNNVAVDLYTTEEFGKVNVDINIPNVPSSIGPIYGMCFSPYMDGQDPNFLSQIGEQQIVDRLNIIAPWCQAVRSFGCGDGLERIGALAKTKGMYVIIGVWLSDDKPVNDQQISRAIAVASAGGCDAISVGSEVLERGDLSAAELIGYIKQVKDAVSVPVTTADTAKALQVNPTVCAECEEFILANAYPYWEGVPIDQALNSLKSGYESLAASNPGKEIIIGETGWPTSGDTIIQAVANPENARRYFTEVTEWARTNNIKVYWFEAFDESWKAAYEGPQGSAWGIFDKNGIMKQTYRELMF